MHEKGLWHREVAVWVINEKGEILIQRRSPNKKQAPNKWALTAGHIASGEDPLDVAVRETEEEIGLNVPENQMHLLFISKKAKKFSDTQYNNHFKYIYYAKTNMKISEFVLQEEELSEVFDESVVDTDSVDETTEEWETSIDTERKELEAIIKNATERLESLNNTETTTDDSVDFDGDIVTDGIDTSDYSEKEVDKTQKLLNFYGGMI